MYMLGVDGTVTGNRVAPVRSACAVLVSSQNADRDWVYYQQQTVSAEGFSGQAFSPSCRTRCAQRKPAAAPIATSRSQDDNNAWMAQVLLQGAGFMNFMGRYIYVAAGTGVRGGGRGGA